MVNEHSKRYCKDDLSKIENYDKAIADQTCTWHVHHRLELTLDGDNALSIKDLIRMNMYYHRPYFELIFLSPAEHASVHRKGKAPANKGKPSPNKGKPKPPRSAEHRLKLSMAHKGKKYPNLSNALKGRKLSKEHRTAISEGVKKHHGIRFNDNL